MKIRKDTWHYQAFEFTFLFSDNDVPDHTTLPRYWVRIGVMSPFVALALVLLTVFWLVTMVVGNLVTILTGWGLFVSFCRGRILFQVREFDLIQLKINDVEVVFSFRLVAAIVWTIVLCSYLAYRFPHEAWLVMLIVMAVACIAALVYQVITRMDAYEERAQARFTEQHWDAEASDESFPPNVISFEP